VAAYLAYVEEFPEPIETAVETRFELARLYQAAHDEAARYAQLRRIVEIDADAGAERSARVRVLAARSALVLAESLYESFGEVALVQPFEPNLQEKQRRMDAALAALAKLVDYEDAEVTAAATFYMAETYLEFSRALIGSERPRDLGGSELAAYESALEEEAFPFEERAIAVHEKNLELTRAGVWNPWIERSLAKLALLVPGRYARSEASSGFLDSLDTYAYQAPRAPAPVAAADPAAEATAAVAPEAEVQPPASVAGESEWQEGSDAEPQ
jgi:hypothetical protein